MWLFTPRWFPAVCSPRGWRAWPRSAPGRWRWQSGPVPAPPACGSLLPPGSCEEENRRGSHEHGRALIIFKGLCRHHWGWLLPQIIGLSMEWSRILVRLTAWFFFFQFTRLLYIFRWTHDWIFLYKKGLNLYLAVLFINPLGDVIRFLNSMDYHPV